MGMHIVKSGYLYLVPLEGYPFQRLVFHCGTTSASTEPCTSRRMCCLTHCSSNCAACQPLLRALSGRIPSPRPTPPLKTLWRSAEEKARFSQSSPSSSQLSGLELGDAKVYAPAIRALLGTASHFYGVVKLTHATKYDTHDQVEREGATRGLSLLYYADNHVK